MKKFKKNLWSEKVPFGYEKKPVFENFPFHTLGYENFGCFFLMIRVCALRDVHGGSDNGDPLYGIIYCR
jgi:hypothetical protein